RWFSLDEARALGYESKDDSEVFAADVPEDDPESLAHRYLGGAWCGPELDTAVKEAGR
ncbi:MAG: NAD(P)-dependent oxidoreductase, partial [Saccharothrix sp.]|nr:NAD(P)-dependent oxidoreductase [Saccharothrix sp.]